ncbi:MAG: D-alanyl-D-alanine endopeptidase [Pandoraea sp.]|nr:MAG: D-alanyl-D-alanine endopeptidase [Pandoraea sp.]TAM18482.1 MAG: D-alanyl-D-alanine endopeptidase [Pandoraea sp.]
MFSFDLFSRLCRRALWGAAMVAATLAVGTAAYARPVACSSKQSRLSPAQKRACLHHTAIKHATLKQHRVERTLSSRPTVVKRVAVKRVVYRGGQRHIVTSYRKVNFRPEHLSPGRAYGLHDGLPQALALRSQEALVVDENTAEVLYDKQSSMVRPIASISKLMTAMVSLDAHIPLTQTMEVTADDRDYEKGTGSRLSVGSRLNRADMLHIALMASENRAAAALSRYYPGGRPAFIAAMNRKARELGMNDTHFNDPTGLSSQNVSSARDLVKMIKAAYQYPLIREFSTDKSYDVNTGRKNLHYVSTDHLVGHPGWQIGLQKTGFINEAGQCLVMQAVVHGRPVIIVLLDSTGRYSRFADAARVRQWLLDGGGSAALRTAGNQPAATTTQVANVQRAL